jgi:hypothetical protein
MAGNYFVPASGREPEIEGMTMRAGRLLFAQPPREASLAPIYGALLALIAAGLCGLAIAFWPGAHEPPERRSAASQHRMQASEGRLPLPPRTRMKSM